MIQTASIFITILFAGFLVVVGVFMGLVPQKALAALRKMGSTIRIHFTELTLRLIAGAGLYGFAEKTLYLRESEIAGLFFMVTSVIIMAVPHSMHNAYAVWWADRLPPVLVRFLGLLPILMGVWLLTIVKLA